MEADHLVFNRDAENSFADIERSVFDPAHDRDSPMRFDDDLGGSMIEELSSR